MAVVNINFIKLAIRIRLEMKRTHTHNKYVRVIAVELLYRKQIYPFYSYEKISIYTVLLCIPFNVNHFYQYH